VAVSKDPYDCVIYSSGVVSDRLFTTSITEGILSIIDLNSFSLLNSITLDQIEFGGINQGIGANRIVITPNKKFALITSTISNAIFVLNVENNNIEGLIYLDSSKGRGGSGLRGIVTKQDGITYVASKNTDSIFIIDTNVISANEIPNDTIEYATIGNITLSGNDPTSLALSSDEKYLYVLNYASDSVSIIDTTLNTVIKTIDVGDGPTEMAEVNKKLYITNFLDSTISEINTETNALTYTITN
jgi:YVTN family beta-propeller protein